MPLCPTDDDGTSRFGRRRESRYTFSIARFEGREKQVGHSYLLVDGQPVDEVEEFAARFREEILPLLQEYCYDDYAMLAKFIGSELVEGC